MIYMEMHGVFVDVDHKPNSYMDQGPEVELQKRNLVHVIDSQGIGAPVVYAHVPGVNLLNMANLYHTARKLVMRVDV